MYGDVTCPTVCGRTQAIYRSTSLQLRRYAHRLRSRSEYRCYRESPKRISIQHAPCCPLESLNLKTFETRLHRFPRLEYDSYQHLRDIVRETIQELLHTEFSPLGFIVDSLVFQNKLDILVRSPVSVNFSDVLVALVHLERVQVIR